MKLKRHRFKVTVASLIRRSKEYHSWREQQLCANDYKCFITGKKLKKFDVHHKYTNFYTILAPVMKSFGLPYNVNVRQIPKGVLNNIFEVFWNKHQHVTGVPMTPSMHRKFHSLYGRFFNTFDQLKEFKRNFGKI